MNYGTPSLSSNNTVNMKSNITKKQYPTMNSSLDPIKKQKVVFILGATGAGKSKLSVDLATHFFGQVINFDKIQFYDNLDIVTNKLIESERRRVPHHLLGFISDPEDFTVDDFNHMVEASLNQITKNGYLPIVEGGSNSYIKALILVCRQLEKIQRLRNELGWNMHRIDVTPVFEKRGDEAEDEIVLKPSLQIVSDFLKEDQTMTIGLYMI
ncbi:hypothetical protein UlMin_032348 [Ulmus minor]